MVANPGRQDRFNRAVFTAPLTALLCALLSISPAFAQGAKTDPAVKMSRSGICHERGSVHYLQTIYFEPFDSMGACLAAGGRRIGEERSPGTSLPDYQGSHSPIRIDWVAVLIGALIAVPIVFAIAMPWYLRWKARRALRSFEDRQKRQWEDHRLDPRNRSRR